MKDPFYQKASNGLADFLTSTLLIILIMIYILYGVSEDFRKLFGLSFGIALPFVMLVTTTNSDILPAWKKDGKTGVIPTIMALMTFWFVFLANNGLAKNGVDLTKCISVSIAKAGAEFIFSYLFVARNNKRLAEEKQNEEKDSGHDIMEEKAIRYDIVEAKQKRTRAMQSAPKNTNWQDHESTRQRVEHYDKVIDTLEQKLTSKISEVSLN